MCGCGSTATSGPTVEATVYVATPNQGDKQEFTDKAVANAYVIALGGGTVKTKQ